MTGQDIAAENGTGSRRAEDADNRGCPRQEEKNETFSEHAEGVPAKEIGLVNPLIHEELDLMFINMAKDIGMLNEYFKAVTEPRPENARDGRERSGK